MKIKTIIAFMILLMISIISSTMRHFNTIGWWFIISISAVGLFLGFFSIIKYIKDKKSPGAK